jgi:hypothetical protein
MPYTERLKGKTMSNREADGNVPSGDKSPDVKSGDKSPQKKCFSEKNSPGVSKSRPAVRRVYVTATHQTLNN